MNNRLTQTLIYFIITTSVQEGGLPQTFFFWIQGKRTRILFSLRDNFYFFLRKVDKNLTLPNKYIFSLFFSQRTITQSNQFFFYQDKRTRIQLYHGPRFFLKTILFFLLFYSIFFEYQEVHTFYFFIILLFHFYFFYFLNSL